MTNHEPGDEMPNNAINDAAYWQLTHAEMKVYVDRLARYHERRAEQAWDDRDRAMSLTLQAMLIVAAVILVIGLARMFA